MKSNNKADVAPASCGQQFKSGIVDGKPAIYSARGLVCVFEAGYQQTREQDASMVLGALNECDRLRADKAELLEALNECRAAMLQVRNDPYTTCCCAEKLALADRSARAAIAKAERGSK